MNDTAIVQFAHRAGLGLRLRQGCGKRSCRLCSLYHAQQPFYLSGCCQSGRTVVPGVGRAAGLVCYRQAEAGSACNRRVTVEPCAVNCAMMHDRFQNVCASCIVCPGRIPAIVGTSRCMNLGADNMTPAWFGKRDSDKPGQAAKSLGSGLCNTRKLLLRFPPFPLRQSVVHRSPEGWTTSLLLASRLDLLVFLVKQVAEFALPYIVKGHKGAFGEVARQLFQIAAHIDLGQRALHLLNLGVN